MLIQSQIRIPNHFSNSLSIAKQGILGDLLAFFIQSLADFNEVGEWLVPKRERIHYIMGEIQQTRRSGNAFPMHRCGVPEITIQIVDHFWSRQSKGKGLGALKTGRSTNALSAL